MKSEKLILEKPVLSTIMIVDDSELDQLICHRAIRRSGLFDRSLTFSNGEMALEYLSHEDKPKVGLVLLDLNMPRLGGLEFLERIPSIAVPPPIALMLTVTPPEYKMAALQHMPYFHGTIEKPITEVALRNLVSSLAPLKSMKIY